jgi:hypothetical protein
MNASPQQKKSAFSRGFVFKVGNLHVEANGIQGSACKTIPVIGQAIL